MGVIVEDYTQLLKSSCMNDCLEKHSLRHKQVKYRDKEVGACADHPAPWSHYFYYFLGLHRQFSPCVASTRSMCCVAGSVLKCRTSTLVFYVLLYYLRGRALLGCYTYSVWFDFGQWFRQVTSYGFWIQETSRAQSCKVL